MSEPTSASRPAASARLSIVTTLYRSAPHVEEFHRRATAAAAAVTDRDIELVFVDDGSPDESLAIAKRLLARDPRVKIVELSRNFGHFPAIMTGLAHTTGDLVFLIDADLEEPPELLIECHRVLAGSAGAQPIDVAYGVQDARKGRLLERVTGAAFYRLFNLLSDVRVPPNIMIARLMTRRYVDALLTHRERELYLGGLLTRTGFRQVPVVGHKDSRSPTTYSLGRKVSLSLAAITAFSERPLGAILALGGAISVLSLLGMTYLAVNVALGNTYLAGWASLMLAICFFGGMTLASIGVLGSYVRTLFVEVKNRPWIVKEVHSAANRREGEGDV